MYKSPQEFSCAGDIDTFECGDGEPATKRRFAWLQQGAANYQKSASEFKAAENYLSLTAAGGEHMRDVFCSLCGGRHDGQKL